MSSSEPPLWRFVAGYVRDLAVLGPAAVPASIDELLKRADVALTAARNRMRCGESFDRSRACAMARLAQSAYFRRGVQAEVSALELRYRRVEVVPFEIELPDEDGRIGEVDTKPIAVILTRANGDVVVAIRGTRGLFDLAFQMLIAPLPGSDHHGAYGMLARSVLRHLCYYLDKVETQHIFVSGHSMGGAIATIVASEGGEYVAAPITGYAFASPASLSIGTAEPPDLIRLRLAGDVVPHVQTAGHAYVGDDLMLGADGVVLKLDGSREATLIEVVETARLTKGRPQSIVGKMLLLRVLEAIRDPKMPLDSIALFDRGALTTISGEGLARQHPIARYVELLA